MAADGAEFTGGVAVVVATSSASGENGHYEKWGGRAIVFRPQCVSVLHVILRQCLWVNSCHEMCSAMISVMRYITEAI